MNLLGEFTRDVADLVRQGLFGASARGDCTRDARIKGLFVTAAFCTLVGTDSAQTLCMLLGSFCIWFVRRVGVAETVAVKGKAANLDNAAADNADDFKPARTMPKLRPPLAQRIKCRLPKPIFEKAFGGRSEEAAVPVVLSGTDWEADVAAIVGWVAPTPSCGEIAAQVAERLRQGIACLFPSAKVSALVHANLSAMEDIHTPSLEAVVQVREEDLIAVVEAQCQKPLGLIRTMGMLDMNRLKKSALRQLAQALSLTGFSFTRSSLRSNEPKVTLTMESCPGGVAVIFDLTVNAAVPQFLAELTEAAARVDPRAKELVLLVTHWAKTRDLCFVSKGFFPPYFWAIKVIYFLQVRTAGEGPLLSVLTTEDELAHFDAAPKLASEEEQAACTTPTPVGSLFKEFFEFYSTSFGGDSEAISIRRGKRYIGHRHQVQVIRSDYGHEDDASSGIDGRSQKAIATAPIIEDPLRPWRTLRTPMTWTSLNTMRAELERANALCKSGSLAALFETAPRGDSQ